MINFKNVSKIYDDNVTALSNINIRVRKGEFVFLVGPSGAGKSTFIKLMTKEINPTSGTIIIFCSKEQISEIYKFFDEKQKKKLGTVRHLVWEKTNPSPMNGQYIYLSGIENAVWFKKKGGTFNAHCKNPVFKYACGRSKLHPTEKNHDLLKELILDNSNEGDIVFDPCSGSGSHLLVAKQNNRQWLGVELNREYFNIASERVCKGGV